MAFRIIIEADDSGRIKVQGIPDNKIVTYGLLKVAEKCADDFFKQRESKIVRPIVGPVTPKNSNGG